MRFPLFVTSCDRSQESRPGRNLSLFFCAEMLGLAFALGFATTSMAAPPVIPVPAELSARLAATTQGAIIKTTGLDLVSLPELDYDKTSSGPPYVFSDNPEYLRQEECAALRQAVKPGVFRLYTYHVNGTTGTVSKIVPVIENLGTEPLNLRFVRRAFAGPSTNYYLVGKRGMRGFLSATPKTTGPADVVVPVKGGASFDKEAEAARVKFDELVHGFYDIEIDQPALITVLQTKLDNDSVEAARRIVSVHPPKAFGAGRGLFQTSNYAVKVHGQQGSDSAFDTAGGPAQVIVADGKRDPWAAGYDDSSSTAVLLKGNYGIVYDLAIRRKSSDGRSLAVMVFNARTGGKWCDNMAAAMAASAGKFAPGVVDIPTGTTYVTGLDNAVVVQVFPPVPEGKEETAHIQFTPPGASCLPVPILLVPFGK